MEKEVVWVPLGFKRDGMVAVATAGCLSLACITSLLLYCASLLYRHRKRTLVARAQEEEVNRALRFLQSIHGALFLNLLVADALQSVSFSMITVWLSRDALPSVTTPTICTVQAVLLQVGNVCEAFAVLLISASLFALVVFSYRFSSRLVGCLIALSWSISAMLAAAGPTWTSKHRDGLPFYAAGGGWCTISPSFPLYRLMFRHLWVIVIAGVNLLLYAAIARRLYQSRRAARGHEATLSRSARMMLAFPCVFFCTVTPLVVSRAAAWAGAANSEAWGKVTLASGTLVALSGAINCALYAFSRAIIRLPSSSSRPNTLAAEGRSMPVLAFWDPEKGLGTTTRLPPRPANSRAVSFEVLDRESSAETGKGTEASSALDGDKSSLPPPVV